MSETINVPSYDLRQAVTETRFKGLWRFMSGFRWLYLWATLSLGVATAAHTGTFLLIGYLVDKVLPQAHPQHVLLLLALAFVGLSLVEGAFSFISGRLTARTAQGVVLRLRNQFFDHLQRLSFTYHDTTKTGDLIQRSTSDVEAIERFVADQAISVGRILIMFVINMVAVVSISWSLALSSVIVIPFIVVISVFFFKRVSDRYEAYQAQGSKVSTTLQENLSGVRVVKAFARQPYEREKFEAENYAKLDLGIRLTSMHALYWPLSDSLCGLQMIGGYVLGAIMVINGSITLGSYLVYVALVLRIIWPMRNLGRLIVQMSTGFVSYNRLATVLKEDQEPLDAGVYQPTGDVRGEIVFDKVSFAYDEALPVLHEIDLRVKAGEVIALLGGTGSGKTSLVNLLPRFYDYTEGKLTLDGVELKDYPRHWLRSQIGIVEQEPFLFSRTIKENITYGVGRDVPQTEVEAVARAAAVHDVIMTFPEGYDTLVGEKGVTLSGGQKQRVAIARTLLKDPRILILDDSTSSVDTETEGEIRAALQRLMRDRTTFVIAHRIQSVMNADQILVLEKGRVVERGRHEELLALNGIYRRIYDMQARIEVELTEEMHRVGLPI